MTDASPEDIASKLLSESFTRNGPVASSMSDPIADTPMVVTLDQLRSYELDPRLTRNPLYEEIKASIRQRGLDAPPPITRRPGADHYIIRNGGNTRLAILRDLWRESKDERFFRIGCLFRPWPERGEIVALTGHLAENELHGGLSFIERAMGVEKVRELYEQEDGKSLSQSELARRLKADGYPVPQPHISRMQEAIQFLLPAIPKVLYAGLGRPQVEQLTSLRRAGSRIWDARMTRNSASIDFATLFQDVLMVFDSPGSFAAQRVQDELIGQMADLLGVDYNTLAFEITDSEKRWQLLNSAPTTRPARRLPDRHPRASQHCHPRSHSLRQHPHRGRRRHPEHLQASPIRSKVYRQHVLRPTRLRINRTRTIARPCFRTISFRLPRPPIACSRSSDWWLTTPARHHLISEQPSCRPSLSRREVSIRSRMSGTSIPASIHPIGCASTSLNSRVRSPTKRVGMMASPPATRASASRAHERLASWTRHQISLARYCHCCMS